MESVLWKRCHVRQLASAILPWSSIVCDKVVISELLVQKLLPSNESVASRVVLPQVVRSMLLGACASPCLGATVRQCVV